MEQSISMDGPVVRYMIGFVIVRDGLMD